MPSSSSSPEKSPSATAKAQYTPSEAAAAIQCLWLVRRVIAGSPLFTGSNRLGRQLEGVRCRMLLLFADKNGSGILLIINEQLELNFPFLAVQRQAAAVRFWSRLECESQFAPVAIELKPVHNSFHLAFLQTDRHARLYLGFRNVTGVVMIPPSFG